MDMYCACGARIGSIVTYCECDWDGWISTMDWPPERTNKNTPIGLPKKDGEYLVRVTQDGDRYESIKKFSLIPRIVMGGSIAPLIPIGSFWGNQKWDDVPPYAWKEL